MAGLSDLIKINIPVKDLADFPSQIQASSVKTCSPSQSLWGRAGAALSNQPLTLKQIHNLQHCLVILSKHVPGKKGKPQTMSFLPPCAYSADLPRLHGQPYKWTLYRIPELVFLKKILNKSVHMYISNKHKHVYTQIWNADTYNYEDLKSTYTYIV